MTADIHVVELIPAYALGCLDEDEANSVSKHLATCPTCQIELQAYQAVVDQLALAALEAVPSPALKDRLLDRIQQPSSLRRPQRQALRQQLRQLTPAWGLASLLLILALIASGLFLWRQFNRPEMIIGPEGLRAIVLEGTGVIPGASGFIIISPDGRNGAVVIDQLPLLEADGQYQLWLIRAGERDSGALLSVDESGYAGGRVRAPRSLFEYSAAEVTIEPAGGSPAPTGDKVLSGSLK